MRGNGSYNLLPLRPGLAAATHEPPTPRAPSKPDGRRSTDERIGWVLWLVKFKRMPIAGAGRAVGTSQGTAWQWVRVSNSGHEPVEPPLHILERAAEVLDEVYEARAQRIRDMREKRHRVPVPEGDS